MTSKGYSASSDMNDFEYVIVAAAIHGQTDNGELIKWVKFTVKDQTGRVLNFGEASSPDDGFRSLFAKRFRGLIKEAVRQLPECK